MCDKHFPCETVLHQWYLLTWRAITSGPGKTYRYSDHKGWKTCNIKLVMRKGKLNILKSHFCIAICGGKVHWNDLKEILKNFFDNLNVDMHRKQRDFIHLACMRKLPITYNNRTSIAKRKITNRKCDLEFFIFSEPLMANGQRLEGKLAEVICSHFGDFL